MIKLKIAKCEQNIYKPLEYSVNNNYTTVLSHYLEHDSEDLEESKDKPGNKLLLKKEKAIDPQKAFFLCTHDHKNPDEPISFNLIIDIKKKQ